MTLELRMPNLHGLIYAAEISVGPVLYPEKYKLHTGMKGVIAMVLLVFQFCHMATRMARIKLSYE